MIILTIKTDQTEAEIGLYENNKQLEYTKWQAHLMLAETIHSEIDNLLNKSSKSLKDIQGIVCYQGPGSFTGLRIGLSVANALAYAASIPIVSSDGQKWIQQGIEKLADGKNDKIALPKYGSEPNVTPPRK